METGLTGISIKGQPRKSVVAPIYTTIHWHTNALYCVILNGTHYGYYGSLKCSDDNGEHLPKDYFVSE